MNTSSEANVRTHGGLPPVDESCEVERRSDGSILIRRNSPLEAYPQRCTEWLLRWAREVPDRVFIAQRPRADMRDRAWDEWTYGMTLVAVRSLGQALLDRGLSVERQ